MGNKVGSFFKRLFSSKKKQKCKGLASRNRPYTQGEKPCDDGRASVSNEYQVAVDFEIVLPDSLFENEERDSLVSEEAFDCACENDQPLDIAEFLELEEEEFIFLIGEDQKQLREKVCKFVKENNYSEESRDFVKEAIKALIKGAEVDFDDRIINKLTGKALCVYTKLKELSTGFKNAIQKFDGEFPVSHLKFVSGNLGNNTRGETAPPINYSITVTLNNNSSESGVNFRPNLLTAKTIIHEVIHSEMFRKMLSLSNTNGNISATKLNQMLQQGDYPGMLDYYTRFGVNGFQHQQMANHYRGNIADVLAQFDKNAHNRQFYLDLAWEGLDKTTIPAWQDAISQSERDKIRKTVKDYINANKNQTCQK